MSTQNCPICGKIFDYNSLNSVCPLCLEKYEADFRKVREYLYDYPNHNIVEVSEATGVSIDKIKAYLREERLVAVNNQSAFLLSCKRCGKAIASGVYCGPCQEETSREAKKEGSYYKGDSFGQSGTSSRMYSKFNEKK